jgi:flagellar basal-body rod modification protein FlgD
MAIDAIGLQPTATTTAITNAGISQDDFLRILLTQLKFQDPTKPVDNKDFMAQLAQFSALEINRQQSDKVESLLAVNAGTQGIALIGRQVEVAASNGSTVGSVSAISISNGEIRLTVQGSSAVLTDVKLSDIRLVR